MGTTAWGPERGEQSEGSSEREQRLLRGHVGEPGPRVRLTDVPAAGQVVMGVVWVQFFHSTQGR
ncbi:hypothetical protein, partial [Streptomyces sp. NPDC050804]|uniref:hypothetical protein n=1 Tax=Streptomyces sp. NPDC050804 TaxID=3154745 RepID=UPI0034252603